MAPALRLFLDEGPGEARGVVARDDRPERLMIERAGDARGPGVGARMIARVRRIEQGLATAFLDAGGGADVILPLGGPLGGEARRIAEGARVEIEVLVPPRRGKSAVVRLMGPGEGEPRLIAPGPPLARRLEAYAPGATIERGREARRIADLGEEEVLAVEHPLPSGGGIAIERTRALVAIDVDVGSATGDSRRAAARANREAIWIAARLLRLKGLGGPVVFDLVGRGHDGEALMQAAKAAFAPDAPGVGVGPITRFGLWSLVLPRRTAPVAEILGARDGALSDETLALRLLREVEAAAGPGVRVEARASPAVSLATEAFAPYLTERIGPRFRILADPAAPRERPVVWSV